MRARAKMDPFRRELLAQPFPKAWEAWLSANMAHYPLLKDAERARLHDDARVLIAEKTWEGCDGLKVTEMMKLAVAAQAVLLLLGLEHDYFSRVLSIVLFPTAFELPAESWEERGRVVAGQAVNYGSVFLSWETVLGEARDPTIGHNLVIHEFAHQLDFLDGYTNGAPPLRSREQTQRWQQVMHGTFQRLRRDLQMERKTFLGSYAATNPIEFFSVASEKFFSLPRQLRQCHPELVEVFHPNLQRRGYATEAVRGLLAYAFTGLRVRRIVAECDSRNLPARGLLLKAGLRQESECIQDRLQKGQWVNTVGFALLKQEYESSGQ